MRDNLFNQVAEHYNDRGYTEEHDFPNEYLLLVNPTTLKRVRMYYNGKIIES